MSKTSTDPIADMLSRIRNAIAVNKHEVTLPHSNVKEAISKLLRQNGYIDNVEVGDAGVGKSLRLIINQPYSNSRITNIKRVSKPGRRQYCTSDKIPVVMHGRGIVIMSTSKGMMTGDEARKLGVGGELICKVY
mgnify:CR=1 FL=1